MGLRGPKPKGKVKIKWSPNFAYAVGLIVTDGNVSSDGRHITFISKDKEQLLNFQRALHIQVPISHTRSGYTGQMETRIQFSDSIFWEFLVSIGVMPNKSKVIQAVKIPAKYFMDFLRGCLDGDGSFYSYFDPRWKSSFMFYLVFSSASREHLNWLRSEIFHRFEIKGHMTTDRERRMYQLKYAKRESLKIIKNMYYSDSIICLSRKREKIEKAVKIEGLDKTPAQVS
jgi:intein-encoded DNA endonuclease-like protein